MGLDQREWQRFVETHGNAKREWTGRATICLHNLQGIFHTKYDPGSYHIRQDEALSKSLFKIPLIPRYVDIATAMIGTNYVDWEVIPEAMTHEARLKADAINVILDQYEKSNHTHINNQHIARMMVALGHAAKRLYQDYEWQTVELEPEEAQIYMQLREQDGTSIGAVRKTDSGKVRMEVYLPVIKEQYLSPFRIVVETGARDLESCNRFVVYEDRPRTDIARFFPEFDLDSVKPDSIPDIHSPTGYVTYTNITRLGNQQTGNSYDSSLALNRLYWCYERLDNGRWTETVYVGQKLEKVVLATREIAFHPIVWYYAPGSKIDECFWQHGIVDRCVETQRMINRSATDQKLNFHALMKDTILIPHNMKNQVTNAYASVLFFDPRSNNIPRRLDMPTNTHQALSDMLARDEAIMARLMGINDMSQGVIKSHVSGSAASQSMTATASPLSLISDGIDAAETIKVRKALRMMKAIFDEPRFFASSGKTAGQTYAKVISQTDLMGYSEVTAIPQSRMPREQQARLQLGLQLASSGMFNSDNPDALRQFKEFVEIEKGIMPKGIDEELERHRARRAIQLIREGRVVAQAQINPETMQPEPAPLMYITNRGDLQPLLGAIDVNNIHIEVIAQAVREETFAAPEQQALAMALMAEHQAQIDNAMAQRYAQQLELDAKQSVASQAGQLALQTQGALLNAPAPSKMKMTPAQGGVLSGQVRRSQ